MSKIERALPLIYDRLDTSSGAYQLGAPDAPVLSYGAIAITAACWCKEMVARLRCGNIQLMMGLWLQISTNASQNWTGGQEEARS